jgi:predicted O-methyltransferase YrrM
MKWRFDIINFLIKKIGAKRYLEIGVEDGDSINAIQCEKKHGVDPASKNATHRIESDEFFAMLAPSVKYDVVFVDGLHVADQAERDIVNSLEHLNDGGYIVVHDCNPPTAWHQRSVEEAKKNGYRCVNCLSRCIIVY